MRYKRIGYILVMFRSPQLHGSFQTSRENRIVANEIDESNSAFDRFSKTTGTESRESRRDDSVIR